jgi:hypothetical protein
MQTLLNPTTFVVAPTEDNRGFEFQIGVYSSTRRDHDQYEGHLAIWVGDPGYYILDGEEQARFLRELAPLLTGRGPTQDELDEEASLA